MGSAVSAGRTVRLAVVASWMLLAGSPSALGQSVPPAGGPMLQAPQPVPGGQGSSRYVLLLYTDARLTPALVSADIAFRSTLESRSRVLVYFHTE